MRRYTISGIDHLVRLLAQYPALMSLGSLAPLQAVAAQAAAESKSCGCNAAKVYQQNKNVFEMALGNLQHGDHMLFKQILNVQEVCFYIKNQSGGLQIKCI